MEINDQTSLFKSTQNSMSTTGFNYYSHPQVLGMITAKAPCPCFEEEMDRINKELEAEYENETQLYYDDLSSKTTNENPIDSIGELEFLLTSVKIEQDYHLDIPDWAAQLLNDKEAQKFIAMSLERFTMTNVAKRFQTGILIKDIIEKMESKKNNLADTKKVYLYSAHDVTIVSLWKVLGFQQHIVPGYGEALVLELHLDQGMHFIQLFRRSWNGLDMEHLVIPGCGKRCSVEKFVTLTRSVAVDEMTWDKECQQTPCRLPLQSGSAAQAEKLVF